MNHNLIWVLHSLNGIAIICTAVVFGTDVFFALIGKASAIKSKDLPSPTCLDIFMNWQTCECLFSEQLPYLQLYYRLYFMVFILFRVYFLRQH